MRIYGLKNAFVLQVRTRCKFGWIYSRRWSDRALLGHFITVFRRLSPISHKNGFPHKQLMDFGTSSCYDVRVAFLLRTLELACDRTIIFDAESDNSNTLPPQPANTAGVHYNLSAEVEKVG